MYVFNMENYLLNVRACVCDDRISGLHNVTDMHSNAVCVCVCVRSALMVVFLLMAE